MPQTRLATRKNWQHKYHTLFKSFLFKFCCIKFVIQRSAKWWQHKLEEWIRTVNLYVYVCAQHNLAHSFHNVFGLGGLILLWSYAMFHLLLIPSSNYGWVCFIWTILSIHFNKKPWHHHFNYLLECSEEKLICN